MQWTETLIADLRTWLELKLSRFTSLPVSKEDLIGEVMLRLYATSQCKEIESPHAYALTILKNLIRDQIRKLERAQNGLEVVARSRGDSSNNLDEPHLDDRELLTYLIENTQLTSIQQEVIKLMYFSSMTITEAARALSKNPGTILRHHERAIEKLSQKAGQLGRDQ